MASKKVFCSNGNLSLLIARHCKKNAVDNAAGFRIEQLDTFFWSGKKIEMLDERMIVEQHYAAR